MDYLNDIVNLIVGLKGPALLMAGLVVVGYVLKAVPVFNNKYIPPAVIALGGIINALFIGESGAASPALRNPAVHLALQGIIIGGVAWVLHDKLLRRLVDSRLPWLKDGEAGGGRDGK